MAFLVLKDITGKIQITIEKKKHEDLLETIQNITNDSVISVTGTAYESEYVKLNGVEVIPKTIRIESIAAPLPIQGRAFLLQKSIRKYYVPELMNDWIIVGLTCGQNEINCYSKVQTVMTNAMREFLLEQNFIEIHTPKLIGAASESGSEVFEVKYFDRNAYLAQSPQFYKQMAMASGMERIFEVGPVFRAEKSYTNKHTTEFTGFDVEFSYISSFHDVMKMEEELLKYMLMQVSKRYGDQVKDVFGCEIVVPTSPFPVVTLKELYEGLEKDFGYVVPEAEKGDLTTEAEKLSYEWVKRHFNHEFLFITDITPEESILSYA